MTQSTILFLNYSELGQATVGLAVAHEFLLRSSYDVHIGSFAPLESAVAQLNARAASQASVMNTATFHLITGPSMKEACHRTKTFPESFRAHKIGFRAALKIYKHVVPGLAVPWDSPEYMAIYQDCVNIIQKTRPAVVVLDPIFLQAIDACCMLQQRYVMLSANTFKELVLQPKLGNIWKYPMVCSGFPYPLPWYLILPNAYLAIRMLYDMSHSPRAKELEKYRNCHGIPGPVPGLTTSPSKRDKATTLLPTRRETEIPCFFPDNFILCGPILRPCAPIAEEDPELGSWLARRSTVLVNLGTHLRYTNEELEEFMKGFRMLLDKRPDIQILWKIMLKSGGIAEGRNLPDSLRVAIAEGRVRVETWLAVEPICILSSGHVQCVVHHGGSNSYQEAIWAAVPQVILPVWYDTYDFACRAEYLGIGVWGSRKAAPAVNGPELGQALVQVLASDQSMAMQDKAKTIASQLGPKEGRIIACDKIISILTESTQQSIVPVKKRSVSVET